MVSERSTWKGLVTVALALVAAAGCATVQAQTAGATNSSPKGPEKPLPGEGRMEKIETDLFGSQRTLDLQPPGTDTPQMRPRILPNPQLDERAREKIDAEKNWMFSGYNALNSTSKPEDLLGASGLEMDSQQKDKLSAMEQFYGDLGGKQQSSSNQLGDALTMIWTVKQLSSSNGVNPIMFAFPSGDASLLKTMMTMSDMSHPGGGPGEEDNSAKSPDAVAAAQAAASADREQKRRLDNFKQLLGLQTSTPAGAPSLFDPAGGPAYSPTGTIYSPASSPAAAPTAPSSLTPVLGAFTPPTGGTYHPTGLNAFNQAMAPAAPEFARPALAQPTSPVQSMPIDPFMQNFPKRKF